MKASNYDMGLFKLVSNNEVYKTVVNMVYRKKVSNHDLKKNDAFKDSLALRIVMEILFCEARTKKIVM